MSLSKGATLGTVTGRVILGPGVAGPQETTVAELESRRSPMHFEQVEAEFWERVRGKAKAKAADIIAQAMAEAEALKAAAKQEGYNAGVAAAGEQIQAELSQMAGQVQNVLAGLNAGRKTLWAEYRQDFVTLLRLAVERTIGLTIDTRREAVLATLLDESLDMIDARTGLTLTVHPDDEGLLRELLARAAANRPDLARWQVKASPDMTPGGVRLESADGMVDNTVESRFAEVETIFGRLAVEEGPDAA